MAVTSTQLLKVFKELERRIAAIDIRQGGPEGPRGPMGPKGRKGDKGPKGDSIVGPVGPKGATGPAGPSGRNGKDGKDGKQGPMGPQGLRGTDGRDGLNGAHGRDGKDGVSVTDVQIDFDGRLTVQLSDGTEIDAGMIDNKVGDTIVYSGGGGGGSGGGGGPVPPHNQLSGLQGGNSSERYHLTAAEHATLIDWANNGLPEFEGSGTSGVVPDPITESGRFLRDDGTWASGGGGGGGQVDSVVGGNAITVDATDPVNPVVNADEFTGANTKGVVTGPAVENDFFLRDDGTFAPTPVSPIGAIYLNMRWNSGTVADDPGSGEIKANNVDQTLATELYVSDTTQPGNNADFIYESLDPDEFIGLWAPASNEQIYYIVTGPLVDNGTWWTIPVARVSGDGGFANNNQIQEFFLPNPNEKIPPGGTTGQVLTKLSNDDYDDAWQTPDPVITDHGGLTGLTDDDHTQYHTDARGDARYPAKVPTESHIADTTIHFTEASIDHTAIQNVGTNTHVQIDSHITDSTIHFADAPNDGKQYGREGLSWTEITGGGGGGFWDANGDDIYNNNVGNVGIGTIPDANRRLHVQSSIGSLSMLVESTVSGAAIVFQDSDSSDSFARRMGCKGDALTFDTAGQERVRITSVGNVGIGKSNPLYPLDVELTAFAGTDDTGIFFGNAVGVAAVSAYDRAFTQRKQLSLIGEFTTFSTGANGSALLERMRINSEGHVGIGTTTSTPERVLTVGGQAQVCIPDASLVRGGADQLEVWPETGTGTANIAVTGVDSHGILKLQRGVTTYPVPSDTQIGRLQFRAPDDSNGVMQQLAGIAAYSEEDLVAGGGRGTNLRFYSSPLGGGGNVERMRITADGVVQGLFTGVGVTPLQSKFEVVSALPGTPDANTIYFVV